MGNGMVVGRQFTTPEVLILNTSGCRGKEFWRLGGNAAELARKAGKTNLLCLTEMCSRRRLSTGGSEIFKVENLLPVKALIGRNLLDPEMPSGGGFPKMKRTNG